MKKEIKGLNGLLPPKEIKPKELKPSKKDDNDAKKKTEKAYKTVSYSIEPLLDEQMRYIAYYDRKKINEVVEEAFKAYVDKWKPAQQFDAELPTKAEE